MAAIEQLPDVSSYGLEGLIVPQEVLVEKEGLETRVHLLQLTAANGILVGFPQSRDVLQHFLLRRGTGLKEPQEPQALGARVKMSHLVPELERGRMDHEDLLAAPRLGLNDEAGLAQLYQAVADPLLRLLVCLVRCGHLLGHFANRGPAAAPSDCFEHRGRVARKALQQALVRGRAAVEETFELRFDVLHTRVRERAVKLDEIAGIATTELRDGPDSVLHTGLFEQSRPPVLLRASADHLAGLSLQVAQFLGRKAVSDLPEKLPLLPLRGRERVDGRGHDEELRVMEQADEQLDESALLVIDDLVHEVGEIVDNEEESPRRAGTRLERAEEGLAGHLPVVFRRPVFCCG